MVNQLPPKKMQPPVAQTKHYIVENHGDKIQDSYHWMRDQNWPKTVKDQDILSYLKQENDYVKNFMAPFKPMEDRILAKLKLMIKEDDESYPVEKDNYFYYSRISKGQNYNVNYRRFASMQAEEEMILDANELAKGNVSFSMSAFAISPDHTLLAYSTDTIGEERYLIEVKDLGKHILLSDKIENTIGNIVWRSDNRGFYYNKLDEKWRHKEVYFHLLGTKQSQDLLVFREKDNTFTTSIYSSSDRKYLFISTSSSEENEIWYMDLDAVTIEPKLTIARQKDLLYVIDYKNEDFYLKINDKGKNFRLIKTNSNNFCQPDNWHEIIPHQSDVYLTGFDLSRDYLVINRRIEGLTQISIFDNNLNEKVIKFDEETYSAGGYFATYESNYVRIRYSSLTTPNSVMEYDYKQDARYVRKIDEIPGGFDSELYNSKRIYAKASDGTLVPVSLVYKKLLFKQDGSNPLYLYGYGSYGISISPSFNRNVITLLDNGFVFAIAHVRGGDDLGYDWYESSKFLNKKRTFTDFIACAECLIDGEYTNSDKIVIAGGSAGGMLMGAVSNMRPDLFKVVIAMVPFVDVLHTMLDETLPLTPGEFKEWGNPRDKKFYDYIKSYSPYENVIKQRYPHFFVTSGINDPRVGYWEPTKWVAKLRQCNTSNSNILLKTEMESGHQGQSGRYNYLKEIAQIYSFIFVHLNVKY